MPRIMSAIPVTALGFALWAMVPLSGCSSDEAKPMRLGLEAQDLTYYGDVPLPLGFKEAFDPLRTIASKGPRECYLHYRGGSDYLSVSQFYFDFLPPQGWKLKSEQGGTGAVFLHYTKGSETLLLSITAGDHATDLIVKLGPTDMMGVSATQR